MNKNLSDLFERLNNKYRLVVMNDTSLEEKLSFRLSRMNVYILFSTLCVVLVLLTASAIILTPLKLYIPGYQDVGLRRDAIQLNSRMDSTSQVVQAQGKWVETVQSILSGNPEALENFSSVNEELPLTENSYDTVNLSNISKEDSILRSEMEVAETYELFSESKKERTEISDLFFTKPVNGVVSDTFNLNTDHFGIDLVAGEQEPVKAVLDGMIIMNEWSTETGYILAIQHDYNLVSFYKHNSVLLKKVGTFVKAGDAIAIIGDSGELSDGPHLHFELWYNQSPVNPIDYILFED